MPIETIVTHNITCGNPACPGTELDPADRTGWTFVTVEVYGQPVREQRVFCSDGCVARYAKLVATGDETWEHPSTTPVPPA
jgi:hypothetical protein